MKSSHIALGVIGLALGALWYSTGGNHPPTAKAADQLQVSEPIAHDNLAVFFVRGPDEVDTTRVVTLQEALERNLAVVHETGQVNTLVVENLSPDCDLFVQSGDIIKGGRQDRMIASDFLLSPSSGRVPVPVHCVEHNRWVGRGTEAATHFAVSNSCVVGNSLKLANVSGDQSAVWANVKDNQDKLSRQVGCPVNAAASPSSLQLALENPAVQAKVEEYRQALRSAGGAQRVVGAVFVVNGKVTSAEVYGSNLLFRKAWPKLLKSAAIEALVEKGAGPAPAALAVRDVEAFLAMGGTAGSSQTGPHSGIEPDPFPAMVRELERRMEAIVEDEPVSPANLGEVDNVTATAAREAVNTPGGQPSGQTVIVRGTSRYAPQSGEASRPRVRLASPQPQPGVSPDVTQNLMRLSFNRGEHDNNQAAQQPDNANRINTNQVQTESALLLESRDAGQKVIHRSYIKK